MKITLKNETGSRISINGIDYTRTMISQSAHGISMIYAETGNYAVTVTIRKDRLLKQDPQAARILFDSRNWLPEVC